MPTNYITPPEGFKFGQDFGVWKCREIISDKGAYMVCKCGFERRVYHNQFNMNKDGCRTCIDKSKTLNVPESLKNGHGVWEFVSHSGTAGRYVSIACGGCGYKRVALIDRITGVDKRGCKSCITGIPRRKDKQAKIDKEKKERDERKAKALEEDKERKEALADKFREFDKLHKSESKIYIADFRNCISLEDKQEAKPLDTRLTVGFFDEGFKKDR